MPIQAVCECGKKFQAKDEYEGRRAICPSCKREFIFQAAGLPVFEEVLRSTPIISTARVDDDDDHCQPEAKPEDPAPRPFWKDPVVVIGAVVPLTILAVFFCYLYYEHRTKEFHWRVYALKLETDDLVKSRQSRAALDKCEEILDTIGDPTKADAKMRGYAELVTKTRDELQAVVQGEMEEQEAIRKAIAAAEAKLVTDAKGYAEVNLRVVYQRDESVDFIKIQKTDFRAIKNDQRKIPWLWEATFAFSIVYRNSEIGIHKQSSSHIWRSVFQSTPDGHGGECWREITESRLGKTIRHHFGRSEWTSDFRSAVLARWLEAFQKYNEEVANSSGLSESDKQNSLKEKKAAVAAVLQITTDELQEILEATD
jgi:hypothetical protein